jgi:cytochrome c oxidase cbb3-type subunit 3
MTTAPKSPPAEDAIREHSYDGIQEYDKRLPNWWLFTLYITIVFWVGYWFYFHQAKIGQSNVEILQHELARIEAANLAASADMLDDGNLWKMSRNAIFVDAGRGTFNTLCASCHKENLKGMDEGGIGPNLIDSIWVHGSKPTDLYTVVDKGVLAKGMPAWGPVIGAKKTAEVVAYVLSHHPETP